MKQRVSEEIRWILSSTSASKVDAESGIYGDSVEGMGSLNGVNGPGRPGERF